MTHICTYVGDTYNVVEALRMLRCDDWLIDVDEHVLYVVHS